MTSQSKGSFSSWLILHSLLRSPKCKCGLASPSFPTNGRDREYLINRFVILMTNNHNIGMAKKQAEKIVCATTSDRIKPTFCPSDLTLIEWAQIAPGKVIVATEDRSWLYQPRTESDRFSQPMEGAGSIATTRKLLDGAIGSAKYAVNSDVRPPALTATRWVWRLAGSYYLTHSVPQLLEEASQKFASKGHSMLAQWAKEKAMEETGHDLLALRDLQALGYDAEAVVKELVPPAAVALINYFTRSVQDVDPSDSVSYSKARWSVYHLDIYRRFWVSSPPLQGDFIAAVEIANNLYIKNLTYYYKLIA